VNARTNPIAATGEERLTRFEAWSREAEFRAARNHPVVCEIEDIARRINGGKQLPRPWSQANGGPY
jgi:hypothetical protein